MSGSGFEGKQLFFYSEKKSPTTMGGKKDFLAKFPGGHKQYQCEVKIELEIVHVTFNRFWTNRRHMPVELHTNKFKN